MNLSVKVQPLPSSNPETIGIITDGFAVNFTLGFDGRYFVTLFGRRTYLDFTVDYVRS